MVKTTANNFKGWKMIPGYFHPYQIVYKVSC